LVSVYILEQCISSRSSYSRGPY